MPLVSDEAPGYKKLSKADLLKKAKACFKLAVEAEAKQRVRENEDLQFQVGELQWDSDAAMLRRGGIIGGQAVPPRPMLSVSLLTQPMQLIRNQAAQAHLGVEVHPVSEGADQDTAEVKQGLYRRIQRDSNADQARLWALDRAIQCGRGYYRINTQYDEDSDHPGDQEIVIERILDQTTVYYDPTAVKADYSDARWCIIAAWVDIDTFRDMYPKAEVPYDDQGFHEWSRNDPTWVTEAGEKKGILVIEYFYKVPTVKPDMDKDGDQDEKQHNTALDTVLWAKMTAREVLEQEKWNGHYIPIVFVPGLELQPYDGERRFEGIVRKSRDGQKFANYAISNLVEVMALEPKAPYIGAEGQFKGHEQEWLQANVRNFPYLEYSPVMLNGEMAPPPQRAVIDGSKMQLALMAYQQAKELVQSTSSVFSPSLGELPKQKEAQSGRAIQALQQQSDAGTSHYINNLATVAMAYEARVILDMQQYIYDRPGRVTQIVTGEDDPKYVMLGKPYVENPGGRPQALRDGQQIPQQGAKFIDLSRGKYGISVNVGKSYQTRLQEGSAEIGQILQAHPELVPIIGPEYFKFQDWPGAKEIGDILKALRDKTNPGLGDKQQGSPEQLQSENQALKQQLQMAQQQLQQASMAIQTEQAKQQASIQNAQVDAQTKQQNAQLDSMTKTHIAQIQQETNIAVATIKAHMDALQAERERQHQADITARQAAHDQAMTGVEQDHASTEAALGRQHEAAMTLALPKPEAPESPAPMPFPKLTPPQKPGGKK